MANIKLEWLQKTFVDSFSVYRSNAPMSLEDMPHPLSIGVSANYYLDTSIIANQTYYYRVSAVRGNQELISDEVEVFAGAPVVNDPFWSNVEFLVYADAVSFPTTNYIDQSSKGRTIDSVYKPQIVAPSLIPSLHDTGNFFIDGATGRALRVYGSVNFGVGDFTAEVFAYLPSTGGPSPWYCRWFDFNALILMSTSSYNNVELAGVPFTISWPIDAWFHLCLMRKNGVLYLFINGNLIKTVNYSGSLSSYFAFGGGGVEDRSLHVYANCLRLTSVSRYAETGFTPPTEKFPNS